MADKISKNVFSFRLMNMGIRMAEKNRIFSGIISNNSGVILDFGN